MPHKNLDTRRNYSRLYRATHLKEMAAWRQTWAKAHPQEMAAYVQVYRKSHHEEIATQERNYRKSHLQENAEKFRRYQARKRGATVGPIDIEAIEARDRMLCAICGERVDEKLKHPHPDSLSFDHSHPLSLGGPHSQENLRVAHLNCNTKRQAGRLPVQMVLC